MSLRGFLVIAMVLVAACGESSSQASMAPAGPPTSITVSSNAKLGQILTDGTGRTLYAFAADKGTTSVCYGDCAGAWPPLLTHGAPTGASGINLSLLGTTKRNDGSLQATYAGHPLYYWVADKKPGDATGQALNNFGAPWYVLSPAGAEITTAQ